MPSFVSAGTPVGGYVTRTRRHGNPLGSPRGDFLRCRLRRHTTSTGPPTSRLGSSGPRAFSLYRREQRRPDIARSTTVFDFLNDSTMEIEERGIHKKGRRASSRIQRGTRTRT